MALRLSHLRVTSHLQVRTLPRVVFWKRSLIKHLRLDFDIFPPRGHLLVYWLACVAAEALAQDRIPQASIILQNLPMTQLLLKTSLTMSRYERRHRWTPQVLYPLDNWQK